MKAKISIVMLFSILTGTLSAQPRPRGTPQVDSLAHDALKIVWKTFGPAGGLVVYGPGETLTDTAFSQIVAADQVITLTGLSPGLIYKLSAVATDTTGTFEFAPVYGVTSSPSSAGTIQAYFNFSANTALSFPEQTEGNVDLGQKLLERISQAKYSIDLALYSFSDYTGSAPDIAGRVADSLVAAHNRGVSVRMVYDDRSYTSPVNKLLTAGIHVVKRNVSVGIMHNKFWIFDARDTSSSTDDWLITGSWNMTDGGTYLETQNALFIQDRSLAAIYTKEFEEMFGSNTDVPDLGAAKFGPYKTNNTPHWTMVGDTKVEVYFSPSDGANGVINGALFTADENIFFALLVFTRDDLASTIISRSSAGVVVKGVMNDTSASQSSVFGTLKAAGLDVLRAQKAGATSFVLHHKYGLIDPFNDSSDPMVITGSHNWSSAANTDNDENTLIIHSGGLARTYVREFSDRYAESGGTGVIVGVHETAEYHPVEFGLSDVWPNPFNPTTHFRFSLSAGMPVTVVAYDLAGRKIDTIVSGSFPAGVYDVEWSPAGATGTYVIVLTTPAGHVSRKILFVK